MNDQINDTQTQYVELVRSHIYAHHRLGNKYTDIHIKWDNIETILNQIIKEANKLILHKKQCDNSLTCSNCHVKPTHLNKLLDVQDQFYTIEQYKELYLAYKHQYINLANELDFIKKEQQAIFKEVEQLCNNYKHNIDSDDNFVINI